MASIPTQEEVLAATRKSQEAMTAAIKTWLETVRTAAGRLPSGYAPLTGKLPKLPQVSLPFADKLPTPQDAVANAYHLAEQLLASQRKFAEDLVKVTAPLRAGYRESSPKVPSRSAWQDAVTDSKPNTPAVSAAPKAVTSTEPKAMTSTAAKAADSTAAKAAPTRPATEAAPVAKSTTARTAPRTAAAKRTTTGSASTTATSARKSTTSTSARKSATASPADSAPKSAGTTTSAPEDTDKS